jgi:putative Mn2+ efflux pump MntP
MTFGAIILLSTALAMDAFAASLSLGACIRDKREQRRVALLCAVFFGGFQFAMVAIGWLLALSFADLISAVDHFIAFGLLLIIGGHMIFEAIKGEGSKPLTGLKTLVVLAFATSIDALAAGVSVKALGEGIWLPSVLTGVITFVLSGAGVLLACNLKSEKYPRVFDALGGAVLIILGIKILIEHLAM